MDFADTTTSESSLGASPLAAFATGHTDLQPAERNAQLPLLICNKWHITCYKFKQLFT